MADNKSPYNPSQNYTTQKGEFIFPHLNTPDDKFSKPGYFQTDLRLKAEQAKVHRDEAERVLAEWLPGQKQSVSEQLAKAQAEKNGKRIASLKKLLAAHDLEPFFPFRDALDDETGEPTGFVDVGFKIIAESTTKERDGKPGRTYSNKPKLWDNSNPPKLVDVPVFNHAKGKISYVIGLFVPPAGDRGPIVTLKPMAVQLIDLAPAQGGGSRKSASDFGFEAEEGTFDSAKFESRHEAVIEAPDVAEGDEPGADGSELL